MIQESSLAAELERPRPVLSKLAECQGHIDAACGQINMILDCNSDREIDALFGPKDEPAEDPVLAARREAEMEDGWEYAISEGEFVNMLRCDLERDSGARLATPEEIERYTAPGRALERFSASHSRLSTALRLSSSSGASAS